MTCLDFLAADADRPTPELAKLPWHQQLLRLPAKACSQEDLTALRKGFIEHQATHERQHRVLRHDAPELGVDGMQQAGLLPLDDDMAELTSFPVGSARLSLDFRLLTPLISTEQDRFTLFDNALRRDPLFQRPHLSAAAVKGLAVDAYQRAFPSAAPWSNLGKDDAQRTGAYRAMDASAARLFGLGPAAEEPGAPIPLHPASGQGRLRFEPLWLDQVQFLVMNPQDSKKACGSIPIQFEAAAPGQELRLRLLYLNPAGLHASDAAAVSADLARLLWALAHYWPALNLGAKRLAGYGAIQPLAARLEQRDWSASGEHGIKTQDHQGDDAWDALAQAIAKGTH